MAHIVFGAPGIARCHLHVRLARALGARGHRVTVLAADAAAFDFFSVQGFAVRALGQARAAPTHVPVEDFARHDLALAGRGGLGRRGAARRLGRRIEPLRRLLESDPPDLLLLHQGRSGLHRLLHYVARESGCRALHTGDGLLQGTMQHDPEGIDGDAAASRRQPTDYLRVRPDPDLLAAALSAWVVGLRAAQLARSAPHVPPWTMRWRSSARCALRLDAAGAMRALHAWRRACAPPEPREHAPRTPPPPPFVAVLLQDPRSARLRLDARPGEDPVRLALATARAAAHLDRGLAAVAVLPARATRTARAQLRRAGIAVRESHEAPALVMTAAAVVTVNHPLGIGALLSGTPVLCTGRGPYAIEELCVRSSHDTLERDLPRALTLRNERLRERFLTQHLGQQSVWCDAEAPDHNGIAGIVGVIETSLDGRPGRAGYRYGPAWPLRP